MPSSAYLELEAQDQAAVMAISVVPEVCALLQ